MQREGNQQYKLAIFDLDGTLTQERSIWEYIHKQLGKWVGFAEAYQKKFLAGLISYEEFCELDAKVWRGMRVGKLTEIAKQTRTCIMCMEPNPKYCHRRFISAHLERKGVNVIHIVAKGQKILTQP